GYHPVQIGDSLNRRYQVVSKLGWGFFSTVWLCMDLSGRRVAVKVLKSGAGFAQAGQDEQALLRYSSGPVSRHPSSQRIVQLLDEFKLVGVNGVLCLVLELLGPSLRTWQLCLGNPGLMQPWVKQILSQVLQGLDYLHTRCKIIHTDIKPENILLHLKEHLKEISVKIADLGSSCWVRSCLDLSMVRQLTSGVWPACTSAKSLSSLEEFLQKFSIRGNIQLNTSTEEGRGDFMTFWWRNITFCKRPLNSQTSFSICWIITQRDGQLLHSAFNTHG
uniref:non-specific serine/threonine protein kinase n=1 Tax=Poecilia mexicana TaxID=48701 RepID=A0A3B3XQ57_9TELE